MDNSTAELNLTQHIAGYGVPTTAGYTTELTDECQHFGQYIDFTGNESRADTYVIKDVLKYFMIAILLTVLVVGTLGNFAFLYVLVRVPHMRNTTNMILANLAFGDIAFVVISCTCYLIYFSQPTRSHYGVAKTLGCIGSFVGQYITYFASLALVTLVSAERYLSICQPIKHRAVNTRSRAVKLIIGSWVISFILSGVAVLQYTTLDLYCVIWPESDKYAGFPVTIGYCLPAAPWGLLLAKLTESVPFFSAFIASSIMYVGIIRRLSNRPVLNTIKGDQLASLPMRAQQVRNQVSKLLITNGLVFFLCNTPSAAVSIYFIVGHLRDESMLAVYQSLAELKVISHGMLFINSAINPFIFNATSSHYRQAFREAFCCGDTGRRARLDRSKLPTITAKKQSDKKISSITKNSV